VYPIFKRTRPSAPPLAKIILDNAKRRFGKDGRFACMPGHPTAWYVLVRNFYTLDDAAFRTFWDLHPPQFKQLGSSGHRENRWSRFYNVSGSGGYGYSNIQGQSARRIHSDGPVDRFLRMTQQLMMGQAAGGHTAAATAAAASARVPQHNSVLVNWYLPSHTIGSHSDDESQCVADTPIFSYSLGGTRRFVFHPKRGGNAVLDVRLQNGDLFVMGGTMQQFFKHSVPKLRKNESSSDRINLTVRAFK